MEKYLEILLLKHHILKLVGEIQLDSNLYFEKALALAEKKGIKNLTLEIASPGGKAPPAKHIFDLISNFPGEITGIVKPHAHSAAAIILQACHKRLAIETSTICHHRPLNICITSSKAKESEQELLKGEEWLSKIIRQRSRISASFFNKLNDCDMVITARQALEFGLIDKIIKAPVGKRPAISKHTKHTPVLHLDNDNLFSIFKDLDYFRSLSNPPIVIELNVTDANDYQDILQVYETLLFYEGHITTIIKKSTNGPQLILFLAGDKRITYYNATQGLTEPFVKSRYANFINPLAKKLLFGRLTEINNFHKREFLRRTNLNEKDYDKLLHVGIAIKPYDFKKLKIAHEIIIPKHLKKY